MISLFDLARAYTLLFLSFRLGEFVKAESEKVREQTAHLKRIDNVPTLKETLEPLKKYHSSRKIKKNYSVDVERIANLKWDLCSTKITTEEAANLLKLIPGSRAEENFNIVNSESVEILHLINNTINILHVVSEWIVFRHKRRNWVAYFQLLPYYFDSNMGYTAVPEDLFWKIPEVQNLLETKYNRYRCAKIIQKGLTSWIDKPVTNDGKQGILCRISWKKICEHSSKPVNSRLSTLRE